MPLYEYQCSTCQQRIEKIQKFSDPELTTCPHCGGRLERTLTAPAVQFKGSGWYKDLYSSAKPAPASSGESTPAAPSTAGSDSAPASSPSSAPAPAAPAATAPAPAPTSAK